MQMPGDPTPFQPSYQPPIPSPAGDPNYGGAPPPTGPAQVNLDVISRAWEVLKPTLGTWVIAFLIYSAIIGVFSLVVRMITGVGMQMPIPNPNGAGGGFQTGAPALNYPMLFIGQLIQFVLTQFLVGGLYRMAINQVRTGGQPNIGDMFSVTDVLPNLLIAAILTGLAFFGGFLLCVIPGLLMMGLFMFTVPLVVDGRMSAIDAMSTSWNTLKSQMGMALLFVIVNGLVAAAGILLCCVGVLVTGPLAILSLATLYRDFFPQGASQPRLA